MKRVLTLCAAGMFLMAAATGNAAPKGKKTAPAKAPAASKEYRDPTTGMPFVFVKGGCFRMGSDAPDANPNEKPVHEVCVSDFSIGKFEVTLAEWEKVMGSLPEQTNKECGTSCPVNAVSWEMVQEFIGKLNQKSGQNYRLPTEAEWEYAARSGGKDEKWAGTSDEKSLQDYAFFYDPKQTTTLYMTGKKKPNGLGIHDMSGNVQEWLQDWYDETYYAVSPKDDPTGPATGTKRVVRGGAASSLPIDVRTTHRAGDDPTVWDGDYGFRLVKPSK